MSPRLKSLELHGYKTFASRTDFEFPGVITAIVGPNGSGKSNIADALRWVLGEQSYSVLRGRKTEDMIFAGSEHRPKAGMASATITFDNSDGWLPIDFSEVAIARRAYRDGQNEYLLNGQRIRLKDVSELLAQSGLAERTYTIIGQGLVDAALSLKPEERRKFFEEAAGIGLYRARKEESLHRLEATRRNLERVHDILSELEPRLASLEKQAKRAQEYDHIKADLRLLLREWYGYHWHKTIAEVAHSQELVRIQGDRQQTAREKLIDIAERMEAKRKVVGDQRTKLNQWHTLSSQKHQEREKVSRDLAVLDERQRALGDQLQALSVEINHLQEEQAGRKLTQMDLEMEITQLSVELTESQVQAQSAYKQLEELLSKRDAVESSIREERLNLSALELRSVQLVARQAELKNRLDTLVKNRENLSALSRKSQDVLKTSNHNIEQARSKNVDQEAHIHLLEQGIQSERRTILELENQRAILLKQINHSSAEHSRSKAQYEVLIQAQASSSGLNQGAKYILDTARTGKVSGQFQAFSSMLDVPEDLVPAISALLGEYLDGIIFSQASDLERVLDLLEAGDKGRALLIPDHLKARNPETVVDDPDCLGRAVDLVGYPDRLLSVANHLLGDVFVVRNRQTARRISHELPGNCRAVTLKGEVFWGSGAISAGLETRSGVISRPRQIKDLGDVITHLEQQTAELESKREEIDKGITDKKERVSKVEENLRDARIEQNRISRMIQQSELEAEQARQQTIWVMNQEQATELQQKEAAAESEQITSEIEKTKGERQALEERLRELNRKLADLTMDDLQQQHAHWETSTAVVSRAVRELERRIDEQQQIIKTGEEREEYFKSRSALLTLQKKQAEEEKSYLIGKEKDINSAIEQLQSEILPAEKELEILESEYAGLQADHLAAQQASILADRLTTQAQLDLSRIRDQMNALKRRIEEDFGLVAFDYNLEVSGQTPLPFEGMVEQLPQVKQLPQDFEDNINRQRSLLRRLGAINPEAQHEYKEVRDRYVFLKNQVEDLRKADADLRQVIAELDELMQKEFLTTFEAVSVEFRKNFTRLFGGGSAELYLMDEQHPAEGGVDIEARLPGRREQGLSLLSGGERSLTAVALIFSLLRVAPTPFCVLDEVDAMLDEANVARFRELLLELSKDTQFIIITHNRNTVQAADVIYGVTMGRDSASQVISLKMDEIGEEFIK